ncbi:hypothetical protein ACHHYP_08762 [Achlya hypogyna]|uniref:Uncharacterized protein n=1 Tax=Achlya hypogyna TaxID=1202772 RepID=A0A1V9ZJY0_ACHHY|nr:hypothetical protein ACHHYP_08762 [Achlya hypogyna]
MACYHPTPQLGPAYSSNSAGDGPEKTRDRKSWFPRFKSTLLGSYRANEMFVCCECAVGDRKHYKGADGIHCACGKDQWQLAKDMEALEYNRRLELCKAQGGKRYDDIMAGGDGKPEAVDCSAELLELTPLPFSRDDPMAVLRDPALGDYLCEFFDDDSDADDPITAA